MKSLYSVILVILFSGNLATAQIYTAGNGVTDIDGNSYPTIIVGNHEWMAENLRTSRYSNGESITNATSNSAWSGGFGEPQPAYCWYDNNSSYDSEYGKLYNWVAATDPRNICPAGWYVPDWEEWSDFLLAVDPAGDIYGTQLSYTAGYKMRGQSMGGSNESGFNGVAAGSRSSSGTFDDLGSHAYWWSTSDNDLDIFFGNPSARWIYSSSHALNRTGVNRANGNSVRCVKGSGTTGVLNHSTLSIEIYPNPATVAVRFNVPASIVGSNFEVVDGLGRTVIRDIVVNTSTLLNIENFGRGLYSIKVDVGQKRYLGKFLVL